MKSQNVTTIIINLLPTNKIYDIKTLKVNAALPSMLLSSRDRKASPVFQSIIGIHFRLAGECFARGDVANAVSCLDDAREFAEELISHDSIKRVS